MTVISVPASTEAAAVTVSSYGAENVLERLFALAQALGNDYVRFVGARRQGKPAEERW